MTRISITGGGGMVGKYLLENYSTMFVPLICDITRPDQIEKCIRESRPDIVLHLAGKSSIDYCEDFANQEKVIQTNVRGTYNVAEVCESSGCQMVMMSSSYVFSGRRLWGKYKEQDTPSPVNFYGKSKLAAEGVVQGFNFKVIRSSYLFDSARLSDIVRRYHKGDFQNFPTFIKRSFVYLPHFALMISRYMVDYDKMPSILHLAGSESVSWFKFISDFFYYSGYETNMIIPRNQEEEGFAPRGRNLGLDTSLSEKLGIFQRSYLDGIREMVNA